MHIRQSSLRLSVILWTLMTLGGLAAEAATYYVAPGGNNGGPGTEAQPFSSPRGCIDRMNGGDTCLIKNGTYTTSSSLSSRPGFNFCERDISGSAASYTTIKNYPGHKPTIRSTSNSAIGVLELGGRCEYYHFEGLKIEGGLTIRSPGGYGTSHIRATGNEITGGFDCDGNWSPVRIEDVSNVTFDHNYVHGYNSSGCGGGTASSSMVKVFCAKDSVFEYNTLDDFDAVGSGPSHGFDDKDTTLRNTYRNNVIAAGGSEGIRIGHQKNCGSTTEDIFIYGNIFGNAGVRALHDVDNIQVFNNTFVQNAAGITFGSANGSPVGRDAVIRDNYLHDVGSLNWEITANTWSSVSSYSIHHNVYDSNGGYRARAYGSGDTTHSSLPPWSSTVGESNSSETNCTVDSSYKVTGGSCLTASSSGGEVGAYGMTDCVGHTCDGSGNPSEEVCGDNFAQGTEVCDGTDLRGSSCSSLGFDSGTLSCASDCGSFNTSQCVVDSGPVCGNNDAENGETCDGSDLNGATCQSLGFDFGSLSCDSDCEGFNTSQCVLDNGPTCGNNDAENGETCDGSDLNGATCQSLGFDFGSLSCDSDCEGFDTSGCITNDDGGSSTATNCADAPSSWLVCDSFEDGNFSYWDDVRQNKLSVVGDGPASGSFLARVQHEQGELTDDWATKFFADHSLLSNPGNNVDEVYVRVRVRFEPGFDFSKAVKLSIMAGFEDWDANYPGPNPWAPFYATMYISGNDPGAFKMERNKKTGGSADWDQFPQNIGSKARVVPGQWHDVQFRLKLNSPGSSNGMLEYWIDGEKKASYSGVNFRDSYTDVGWNHLVGISANTSGASQAAATQKQDWDDVVCSTGFIDDDPVTPGPLGSVQGLIRTDVAGD